jgi:hypothetical protein
VSSNNGENSMQPNATAPQPVTVTVNKPADARAVGSDILSAVMLATMQQNRQEAQEAQEAKLRAKLEAEMAAKLEAERKALEAERSLLERQRKLLADRKAQQAQDASADYVWYRSKKGATRKYRVVARGRGGSRVKLAWISDKSKTFWVDSSRVSADKAARTSVDVPICPGDNRCRRLGWRKGPNCSRGY